MLKWLEYQEITRPKHAAQQTPSRVLWMPIYIYIAAVFIDLLQSRKQLLSKTPRNFLINLSSFAVLAKSELLNLIFVMELICYSFILEDFL